MKHYQEMHHYSEYKNRIIEVFENPDRIIFDSQNSEYLYIQDADLLRIKLDGEFVSLYPGVDSARVTKAIKEGGLLWGK